MSTRVTKVPRALSDVHDAFVHGATRSFALDLTCPEPPSELMWVSRAVTAGVLAPVVSAARRDGRQLPSGLSTLRLDAMARHLRTMEDLRGLGSVLDDAEVAYAVLKGPVLRSVVFAQPDVRDYTDLDILVRPAQMRQTLALLGSMGATLRRTDWDHITQARTAELSLDLPHGTVLDLHCHLVNRGRVRDGFALPPDELLERRVERTVDGVTFASLDDLDFVLHVLLHACLSGGAELRWLLDAQQCTTWLQATPGELATRAAELGLTAPARIMLDSVTTHLDSGVAPWAEAMGGRTPWTRSLAALGKRRPPSSPSLSPRTTRTWFSATRSGQAASWRSAAGASARAVRHARRPWPEPLPTPVSLADPGLERWLGMVEQTG